MMTSTATAARAQRGTASWKRGRGVAARRATANRRSGVGGHSISRARAVSRASRSAIRGLLDERAQPVQRARQTGLHSSLGYTEHGCGLLAREFEQVAAGD